MSGSIGEVILCIAGSAVGTTGTIVFAWFSGFFKSYLSEKGKNLATKEDVEAITREVERVRHDYSTLLEEMKARHQLRLAALDKRLEVHQRSFVHWRRLFTSDAADIENIAKECGDWWNENCLYLEPDVRQAFLG